MRHRKAGLKLNRTSSHRDAMFRNMVTSLFKHQRIRTTDVKAKELRRWADNLITLAKRGDLHARRQALSIVREKEVVHKLFAEAAEQYGDRTGGYTRITKLGRRPGDAAPISLIELVLSVDEKKKKTKKKKKAKDTIDKKIVGKKKDIKESESVVKKKALEEDIEEQKADEEEKAAVEEEKGETSIEQVKLDDKSALLESDTISEDADDEAGDETLESAESEETENVETEVKKPPKKAKDTESEA
ncbi:MAG: 50S ribosomal protein L17 [Desulfobacteraceae bacterium]|nr:50S ribosomal protein L17 [Desulfobacteraceae bacterium]